jgi:hypothetical protein
MPRKKIAVTPQAELNDTMDQPQEQDRRAFLMTAAAIGVTALMAPTAAIAGGAQRGRALDPQTVMKFGALVMKCWEDKNVDAAYRKDPKKVLAQYGIQLGRGVPPPVMPRAPEGGVNPTMGRNLIKHLSFEDWDVAVRHLGEGGALGISVSSLACVACPVSSFSSISN